SVVEVHAVPSGNIHLYGQSLETVAALDLLATEVVAGLSADEIERREQEILAAAGERRATVTATIELLELGEGVPDAPRDKTYTDTDTATEAYVGLGVYPLVAGRY